MEFRGFAAASHSKSHFCIVRVYPCWSLPWAHLISYFMRDTVVKRMAWNQTGWVPNPISTTQKLGNLSVSSKDLHCTMEYP